jgi:hypothetical protein
MVVFRQLGRVVVVGDRRWGMGWMVRMVRMGRRRRMMHVNRNVIGSSGRTIGPCIHCDAVPVGPVDCCSTRVHDGGQLATRAAADDATATS